MKTAYLIYCANNPNFPHFPEASLALAAELNKIGVSSVIIDLRLGQDKTIQIHDPLFFGFTVYSNESIKYALTFAQKMRKIFPDIPLVWGGPHLHMRPEESAAHELVDLACYGEGETTVRELSHLLLKNSKDYTLVPGVVFKKNNDIHKTERQPYQNIDSLNFYQYELVYLSRYARQAKKHFYYQTSRGCVHKCRFCNYNYQYIWRGKSVLKVKNEIKMILERFKPYEFYFSDANFFANKERFKQILSAIKEMSLKDFRWTAFCRFDDLSSFSDETLDLMRSTGCFKLNLGGESGSDKVLNYLNKSITVSQITEGLERCRKYGIIADVSFIAGLPHETEDDLNKTLDIILHIYKNYPQHLVNGLFYYQPYPNTPLMEEIALSYDIPIPRDLAGWGLKPVTAPYRQYLPWLSDKTYAKIFTLTQIVNFLYLKKRLKEYVDSKVVGAKYNLLLWLTNIFMPFVKLRLEKKNFIFPFEWKLYYLIKKYFIGMDL